MKPRRILAIWLSALGVAAAARSASFSEPILPSWADGEREAMEEGGWIAGSILLTDEPIPEEAGAEEPPPETAELDIAEPTECTCT